MKKPEPEKIQLKVQGIENPESRDYSVHLLSDETITPKKSISIGSSSRGGGKSIDLDCKEDDIINIEFDDGGEWIGSAADISEIFGDTEKNRGTEKEGAFTIPTHLRSPGDKRWLGGLAVKLLRTYEIGPEKVASEIGKKFDQLVMPKQGLYRVDDDFKLTAFKSAATKTKHYLLFIHGTGCNTAISFSGLMEDKGAEVWDCLRKKYKNNILTFEHKTVSLSPVKNTIALIKQLPDGCTLDMISHSRGGIIADLLARCDTRNSTLGFSKEEISLLKKEDKDAAKELEDLTKLATVKSIKINKTVRIACPSRGTVLLSERLDHYFNGLLRAIGLAVGGRLNPLYNIVRSFLMEIIKSKISPEHLPGINAMVPDATFQKILNNPRELVKGDLMVIEGDSEFGGSLTQSILVIFSNLFYWKANDFVVNTDSMRYGVKRESGVFQFLSKDNTTNHFNYFSNYNTQCAIKNAIEWKDTASPREFNQITWLSGEVGADRGLLDLGEEKIKEVSTKRPIVILIPGIMGSNLEVNGDKIWLHFVNIFNGKLKTHLHLREGVKATSIIAKYYSKLVEYLNENGFDVRVFPYDWRRSLKDAAEELKVLMTEYQEYGQPIKLLSHSMGGLVVRDLMRYHKDFWEAYIQEKQSKFIMLGTPWKGSYLIMEVLTGFSKRVKQLSLLDFRHSKDELLETFQTYEGLYQLLPLDERRFEAKTFWEKEIDKKISKNHFPIPPEQQLRNFAKYKKEVLDFYNNAKIDYTNIYYIAGHKKTTISDYKISKSFFRSSLRFLGTSEGDGSVTYELGIPEGMPPEQLYYTNTEHGSLANDRDLFSGVRDILEEGKTNHYHFRDAPPSISGRSAQPVIISDSLSRNEHEDAFDNIFGISGLEERTTKSYEQINVSITHADLRVASFPVMVGHFKYDGIVSAEAALNKMLNHKLEERQMLGNYPGEIEDNFIIYNHKFKPKGALVIGLGDMTSLTAYNLMKSVEHGVINYALHIRDNIAEYVDGERFDGITSLFIGSGFANLSFKSSLKAILNGVNNANIKIHEINANKRNNESGPALTLIKNIEFIELYEHISRNAFYALKQIEKQQEDKLNIRVKDKIVRKYGGRKKIEYGQEKNWWHQFTTKRIEPKEGESKVAQLQFQSSSGIARVEQQTNFTSEGIVNPLLKEMSTNYSWDEELSKTLFELMIPNDFKEIIRNQNNIHWKMDIDTAAYPWEMFHDMNYDKTPTFVNAGLIRQLLSDNYRRKPQMVRSRTALVIGDPIYKGAYKDLPQLPSAKKEAELIHQALKKHGFELPEPPLIRNEMIDVLKQLYTRDFKILHIAGHGSFDPDTGETGIVLGDALLAPQDLKKLPQVPEFVFINCCYSGTIDSKYEHYSQYRYKFAANVGTQLISMGVNAAVVTGWAVDDDAAALFARVLYERMLDGHYFGDAVQLARKKCFEQFKKVNTWGAYQCYGNPWYKFDLKRSSKFVDDEFITLEEFLYALDNIAVDTQDKYMDRYEIIKRTENLIKKAKATGLYNKAEILEKEAQIYDKIGELESAIDKYKALLQKNQANFSVKSLEQYCNLQAKLLVKNNVTDDVVIDDLLEQFRLLLLIGETPERLSLSGSAYKRTAMQREKKAKRKEDLATMSKKYEQAFQMQADEHPKDFTYPLSNWLTAHCLLNKKDKIKFEGKEVLPITALKKVKKRLEQFKTGHADFWEDIALINILLCLMLYSKTAKEIKEIKNNIIDQYVKAYKIGGTPSNLKSETEHLDFILKTIKTAELNTLNKKRIAALEEIKKALEELAE